MTTPDAKAEWEALERERARIWLEVWVGLLVKWALYGVALAVAAGAALMALGGLGMGVAWVSDTDNLAPTILIAVALLVLVWTLHELRRARRRRASV